MSATDRLKGLAKGAMKRTGYRLVRDQHPHDWDEGLVRIVDQVAPYTMTIPEDIHGMVEATRYVVKQDIPGAIVECGVWRGGSSMASMLATIEAGHTDRDYWLYDTYEGMTPPTEHDRKVINGMHASEELAVTPKIDDFNIWCIADIDDVQRNVATTGYPSDRVTFVKGPVEETIPGQMPDQIALLRLDTDWYESTRHELIHLWPRLVPGGLVILDDYGFWEGQRRAVDEFFEQEGLSVFLHRMSFMGRIGIKTCC